MKKITSIIITVIITVVVVLLLLVMILLGYLFIKNPFGLGDLVKNQIFNTNGEVEVIDSNYDHPLLSEEQEQRLIDSGIDPAKIPTEITPEMESCVTSKISEQRTQEIIDGAEPTLLEIGKILPCL